MCWSEIESDLIVIDLEPVFRIHNLSALNHGFYFRARAQDGLRFSNRLYNCLYFRGWSLPWYFFQRARKIFDPADHDVPSRIMKKFRTNSPSQQLLATSNPEQPINRSGSPQTTQELKSDQTKPISGNQENSGLDVQSNIPVPVPRSVFATVRRSSTGKQLLPVDTQSKPGSRKPGNKPDSVRLSKEKSEISSQSSSDQNCDSE